MKLLSPLRRKNFVSVSNVVSESDKSLEFIEFELDEQLKKSLSRKSNETDSFLLLFVALIFVSLSSSYSPSPSS